MSDLIDRQAAIDLWEKYHPTIAVDAMQYDAELRQLPPASCSEFPNNSDLISRQAAIDAINRLDIPEDMCVFEILSHIELELGTLPSAQPEQRWIPCSERLPEVYKDVLICWDFKGNREVLIGNMYSDGTFHGYDDEYLTHNGRKYRKAVAWMPLPEPWRGDSICK